MSEIADFLVHALALENQAAQRYGELSLHLEGCDAPELAALFGRMSDFSRQHASQITQLARPFQPLPVLQSWQFDWTTPLPPEVSDGALIGPDMTIAQALALAIGNERRGWDYYNNVALTAGDFHTRMLARDFAAEEAQHVLTLERWLLNHNNARGGNSVV